MNSPRKIHGVLSPETLRMQQRSWYNGSDPTAAPGRLVSLSLAWAPCEGSCQQPTGRRGDLAEAAISVPLFLQGPSVFRSTLNIRPSALPGHEHILFLVSFTETALNDLTAVTKPTGVQPASSDQAQIGSDTFKRHVREMSTFFPATCNPDSQNTMHGPHEMQK